MAVLYAHFWSSPPVGESGLSTATLYTSTSGAPISVIAALSTSRRLTGSAASVT